MWCIEVSIRMEQLDNLCIMCRCNIRIEVSIRMEQLDNSCIIFIEPGFLFCV